MTSNNTNTTHTETTHTETPDKVLRLLKEYLNTGQIKYNTIYQSNGGFDYWFDHVLHTHKTTITLSNP